MKKIIKWSALSIALIVLASLFYYVKEKKARPIESSDELLRLALIEINGHKNYQKAIELTRQALRASPGYVDVRVTLGRAYMLSENIDSAKMNLEKAIVQEPKNAQALLYLINISLQQKDTVSGLRYLNSYVRYYPDEKESRIKEYVLLLEHRNYSKAEEAYSSYAERFGKDSLEQISFGYWQIKATAERNANDLSAAFVSFRQALRYRPRQPKILQELVNISIHLSDYATALQYNNELLAQRPGYRQYLLNESTIYQQLNKDDSAALYAGKVYALKTADGKAKKAVVEMDLSFAKDETSFNKVKYASLVLKVRPAEKEAFLYLVNGYLEMNNYALALEAINHALVIYPDDQVFIDKKIGILDNMGNYIECADYIESVLKQRPGSHYINAYDDMALKLTLAYIRQQDWNNALKAIQKGLSYNRANRPLLEELLTVYVSQKNMGAAVSTIDQLLSIDPANETYLFKKSGLLETQHAYEAAIEISGALYRKYPAVNIYKQAYLDQLSGAQKAAIIQMDWTHAIQFYNQAKLTGTPQYFQFVYAIASYNGTKDLSHVLALTDTALTYYPNDSLFLVKRSLAYSALSFHQEALTVSRNLINRYPADTAIQAIYLDQLYVAGKYYEKENKNDSAIGIFLTAHTAAPKGTFALMNLSAIYFVKRQYDSSILYADMGLRLDSNNVYLLMKKAGAHEQLKQYRPAYSSVNRVLQLHPSAGISDYADYLKNKTYQNQFGITHLQSFFSSPGQYASVTGLQYMRRFEKGSITANLNYGDRPVGIGVQGGVDLYYKHSPHYYSNLFVNASSGKSFPYWQAGYSLFRNFKKGWEGEVGVRYLGFDSINNYTATVAAGKYINNAWVNARVYFTNNTRDWFQSYQLTFRQYLNDKNDYLSLIGGLGNIPDDQSLYYNFHNFSGLTSRSIGVGFQKNFRYRTTFQAFFNYNNLQVTQLRRIDQYDIYLTLLRNF